MRLPIFLADTLGAPIIAEDLDAELTVGVNGGAFGAFGGTWDEIGEGAYVYELSAIELAATFIEVRVTPASGDQYVIAQSLPLIFELRVGATGVATYLPVYLRNTSGVPVTGATPTGAQLQISLGNNVWADGLGSWHESGHGCYYYVPTAAEIAAADLGMLKVNATGAVRVIYAYQIGPAATVVTPDEPTLPVDVVHDEIEEVDHVAVALSRIPQQFRP